MTLERWDKDAERVAELALREALSWGHNYIGPVHIALALTRFANDSGDGVLHAAFRDVGVKPMELRSAIQRASSRRCPTCGHVKEIEA